jgi:hypothetical protein
MRVLLTRKIQFLRKKSPKSDVWDEGLKSLIRTIWQALTVSIQKNWWLLKNGCHSLGWLGWPLLRLTGAITM